MYQRENKKQKQTLLKKLLNVHKDKSTANKDYFCILLKFCKLFKILKSRHSEKNDYFFMPAFVFFNLLVKIVYPWLMEVKLLPNSF